MPNNFRFLWLPKKIPREGTIKRRVVDSLIKAAINKKPLKFSELRMVYQNVFSERAKKYKGHDFNIGIYTKTFGVKKGKEGWVASSLTLFLAGYDDLIEDRIKRELNGV